MSLHRRAAKRDAAEPAIVSALEALGCVVWRVSGKGLPDLIVLRAGKKWLVDVKGPKEKATPAQEKAWDEAATKARCAVFILRTPEDAQKMLNNALQSWEPTPTVVRKDMAEFAKAIGASSPRKGDAAKARNRCGKNGCRRLRPCATHDDTETQRRLMAAYTPPRSTPVDAAKAAEATFAPRACNIATDPCGTCDTCREWVSNRF